MGRLIRSVCTRPLSVSGEPAVSRRPRSENSLARRLVSGAGAIGHRTEGIPAWCPADRARTAIRLGQARPYTLLGCQRRHPRMRQKAGPHDRLGLESEDNFFWVYNHLGPCITVIPPNQLPRAGGLLASECPRGDNDPMGPSLGVGWASGKPVLPSIHRAPITSLGIRRGRQVTRPEHRTPRWIWHNILGHGTIR